jgi:hypothetical protein
LSLERFLFIKTDGGERRRWLNVSGRTVQQIEVIVDEIAANGFAQITDASGFYQVYGVYRSTVESTEPLRVFIDFSHISVSRPVQYFIPAQDAQIIVSYDNRMPIKVFGGDSTVGETVFAPIDCEYNANAEPADAQNDFRLNVAFPLRKYYLNPLQLIARKTSGFGIIQDENKFQFDELVMGASPARIRQLLVQFCCESRAVLPAQELCYEAVPMEHRGRYDSEQNVSGIHRFIRAGNQSMEVWRVQVPAANKY